MSYQSYFLELHDVSLSLRIDLLKKMERLMRAITSKSDVHLKQKIKFILQTEMYRITYRCLQKKKYF